MTEWTVVTVVIALVGLVGTITGACVRLSNAVQRNTAATEMLTGQLKDFSKENHEAHEKMWSKFDAQDKTLGNHETRIKILEHDGKED